MLRATDLAHHILRQALKPGSWAVDATAGNGHDTLFLAECVGASGRVFGFDIQKSALSVAAQRIGSHPQVTLVHASHEHLAEHLGPDANGRVSAVMFNLGYLPGGDKTIITRTGPTLAGLTQAMGCLGAGGLITIVSYPGHPGGEDEATALRAFIERLPAPFAAARYTSFKTLKPAPELNVIERLS